MSIQNQPPDVPQPSDATPDVVDGAEARADERHDEYDDPDQGGES
jgi:hypothetical protein